MILHVVQLYISRGHYARPNYTVVMRLVASKNLFVRGTLQVVGSKPKSAAHQPYDNEMALEASRWRVPAANPCQR